MTSKTIDESTFRSASGLWATGVSIVTTSDLSKKPFGLTMNSVTSLSLKPPMFLVCVDLNSDTMQPMLDRGAFCINILTVEQEDLSNRFAKKGENKFDDVDWAFDATSTPVIGGSFLSIECITSNVYEGGDHRVVCGEVSKLHFNQDPQTKPLIYFKGGYRALLD